jgi:hypothetical protein
VVAASPCSRGRSGARRAAVAGRRHLGDRRFRYTPHTAAHHRPRSDRHQRARSSRPCPRPRAQLVKVNATSAPLRRVDSSG